MKIISVKGKNVTLELSDDEHNILFRAGLQLLIDKLYGKKIVVLPVGGIKLDKDVKKVEVDDGFCLLCIQEAFNQGLREYLKREYPEASKKVKKVKKTK